jgi:hypothetical protein
VPNEPPPSRYHETPSQPPSVSKMPKSSRSPGRSSSKVSPYEFPSHNVITEGPELTLESDLNGGDAASKSTPTSLASSNNNDQKIWRQLMQNVDKSIEELYDHCDMEGNEYYCQEAFNMLYKNTRDMWNLIDRLIQQRDFSSHTISSISWEIRKPTTSTYPNPVRYVGLHSIIFL